MRRLLNRLALGGGAAGLSGLVGLAPQADAAAPPLTQAECRIVSAIAVEVIKAVGRDTLSVEFRQSFRNWLGADLTCDGPREIATPTTNDIAAYNTIRTVLASGEDPIDLQAIGLKAVPYSAQ